MTEDTKKKTTTKKTTTSTSKSSTTSKKTTTKKSTTTKKATTPKRTTPVRKEPVVEKKIEETIDDIDIVFETKKIPIHIEGAEEVNRQIERQNVTSIEEPIIEKEPVVEKVKLPKESKKKKFRLSKRGIIIIALLFILIDAIFVAVVVTISKSKKEKTKEENVEVIELDKKKDSNNDVTEDKSVKNIDRSKYDLDKLKQLDDIDTKIDFFNYNNIDRYIDYKKKHSKLETEMVIVYVNIGLDRDFYTDIKNSPYTNTNKVIANKYYKLDNNYEPSNLVNVDSKYSSGSRKMVKEAAEAFNKLAEDAKKEGLYIRAVSTYRSYTYQNDLYNRYVSKDGQAAADTYSARAGHSEHQTGLAVDVDNIQNNYTDFGITKEFTWMKENAYKYGYILRYTKDNEWITGYKDEPWHYRYVGKEVAEYIQNNPMTYEEYFVRFIDK